ncbi:SEP2 [Symbiodinium sp. KB8]|nr:SEP2 [Symbiodinium sp. KB8]
MATGSSSGRPEETVEAPVEPHEPPYGPPPPQNLFSLRLSQALVDALKPKINHQGAFLTRIQGRITDCVGITATLRPMTPNEFLHTDVLYCSDEQLSELEDPEDVAEERPEDGRTRARRASAEWLERRGEIEELMSHPVEIEMGEETNAAADSMMAETSTTASSSFSAPKAKPKVSRKYDPYLILYSCSLLVVAFTNRHPSSLCPGAFSYCDLGFYGSPSCFFSTTSRVGPKSGHIPGRHGSGVFSYDHSTFDLSGYVVYAGLPLHPLTRQTKFNFEPITAGVSFMSDGEGDRDTSQSWQTCQFPGVASKHYPHKRLANHALTEAEALANDARRLWSLFRSMRAHRYSLAGIFTAWRQWAEFSSAHRIYKARAKQRSKQRKTDLLCQAQQAADKGNAHELWKTVKLLAPKAPRKRLQLHRNGHMISPEEELEWILEAYGERYATDDTQAQIKFEFPEHAGLKLNSPLTFNGVCSLQRCAGPLRPGVQISLDLSAAFDMVEWAHVKQALDFAEVNIAVQEVLLLWLTQAGRDNTSACTPMIHIYVFALQLSLRILMEKTKAILKMVGYCFALVTQNDGSLWWTTRRAQVGELQKAVMKHTRAIIPNQAFLTGDTHESVMQRFSIPKVQNDLRNELIRTLDQNIPEPDSDLDERHEWACPFCETGDADMDEFFGPLHTGNPGTLQVVKQEEEIKLLKQDHRFSGFNLLLLFWLAFQTYQLYSRLCRHSEHEHPLLRQFQENPDASCERDARAREGKAFGSTVAGLDMLGCKVLEEASTRPVTFCMMIFQLSSRVGVNADCEFDVEKHVPNSASAYPELPVPNFKRLESIVLEHTLATAMGRIKLLEFMPWILASFGFARLVACQPLKLEMTSSKFQHLCISEVKVYPAQGAVLRFAQDRAQYGNWPLDQPKGPSEKATCCPRNENFDDTIAAAGKNALVLFCSDFCPWCKNKLNVTLLHETGWAHSAKMGQQATWTELMADWQGSDKVLVAHIDCGQPAYDLGGLSSPGSVPSVCKKHEIDPVCDKKTGHIPTIKYFDRQQSKWFRYKRDWEADVLEAFIHERLVPNCIVRTHEHCEDKDLAYLDKHTGKSRVSLQAEQKRLEGMKSQGKFTREQLV